MTHTLTPRHATPKRFSSVALLLAAALALALAPSGAFAAGFAPSDYFRLDIAHAVLAPQPLGPPAQFAPYGVVATSDPAAKWLPRPSTPASLANAPGATNPAAMPATTVAAAPAPPATSIATAPEVAPPAVVEPAPAAKHPHRVAQRRVSPLEAHAAMPKPKAKPHIQRWPCKSGGICGWQTGPQ